MYIVWCFYLIGTCNMVGFLQQFVLRISSEYLKYLMKYLRKEPEMISISRANSFNIKIKLALS